VLWFLLRLAYSYTCKSGQASCDVDACHNALLQRPHLAHQGQEACPCVSRTAKTAHPKCIDTT
jgi:hypothetical protein